jgi:acetyltransferase-like isoleucine patch superfamily enzyme
MISFYCGKLLKKSVLIIFSMRFRLRFFILTGKIKSDSASISKSSIGKQVKVRGAISISDSCINLGDYCSIAKASEIGVEKNGCITVGKHVALGPRTIVSTTAGAITIGNRTSFFSDCIISGMVLIGEGCLFAKNVTVLSGTHQIYGGGTIRQNDASYQAGPNYQPMNLVTIGDDCWLGSNSVILPGVSLGKGTVVGANTVVTKSFPDYSIVGGVPAKIIGSRLKQ